ncbi:BCAS2-domain-containing protein [Artomyces pyxidatus]|uniref:BCAS2-domain-containing protein n=1 Tax=Artomyces pyxidatus TaxID=48021 RepID=A0ACB8THB3_9AGAM|nr:BCAS2-domain-containing protein [Artomyces pyxidatus]
MASELTADTPPAFDSLPYYDNDLELLPVLREKVQHELAVETQKVQQETLHPRVPPAIELFKNNEFLAAELRRVEARQPLAAIDTTRYQLPAPTAVPANDDDWKAALDNAHAQLEHQRIRHNNLALLQQYGSNAWRIHNYVLEADTKRAEKLLEELKEQTTDVNRDRKNAQTRLGNQLTALETRWTELISSVLQIEMANIALEGELQRLNRRETELAGAFCNPKCILRWTSLSTSPYSIVGRLPFEGPHFGRIQEGKEQVASRDAFMENQDTFTLVTSGSTDVEGRPVGVVPESVAEVTTSGAPEPPPVVSQEKESGDGSHDTQGLPNSLTSLKASAPSTAGGASSAVGTTAPHPKKFTTVNINKKFMEKNHATPGSNQASSSSAAPKSLGSSAKPPPSLSTSHSRLVTTKLTALPPPSTTTGPGWSRPASATPPVVPSPGSAASPANLPPTSAPVVHGPPQLPLVGKVIQPQPRGTASIQTMSKGDGPGTSSSKQVWGNVKPGATLVGPEVKVHNDFPTAAEVAQGRVPKLVEKKKSTSAEVPQTPALAEADTFRGVHLDPNAHHWDEEEDDDDFLGGVIEFGDGRQYQIQPTEAQPSSPPLESVNRSETDAEPSSHPPTHSQVNKEDRFADDFDRSWPRSRPSPTIVRSHVGPPHAPGASASSTSSLSPQDGSRVLFNERSNRLEPYSNSHPRPGNIVEGRNVRDVPPHHSMQLLHKGFDRPNHVFPGSDHDRYRDRESRRDTISSQGSEDRSWDRGRRISNASQPHAPLSAGRDLSREGGRQLPPHLASLHVPPPPSSRQPSTREPWHSGPSHEEPSPVSSRPIHSPSATRESTLSDSSPQSSTVPLVDVEDVRKAAMHSAAERAKIRRQQEEEEREKERERARKKAAALEEKMRSLGQSTEKPHHPQTTEEAVPDKPAVPTSVPPPISTDNASFERPPLSRPPSLRPSSREAEGAPRAYMTRTPSFRGSQLNANPLSAGEPSSWRSKAGPLPPIPPRPSPRFPPPHLAGPAVLPAPPPKLPEVEILSLDHDEGLEEVDFTDLGKFVGSEEPAVAESSELAPSIHRTSHALRSEHREDRPPVPEPTTQPKGDAESSWRRKQYLETVEEQSSNSHAQEKPSGPWKDVSADVIAPSSPSSIAVSAHHLGSHYSPTRPFGLSSEHTSANASFGQSAVSPAGFASQRSPRTQAYREAPMSALDDTMSRIKGALDVMLTQDAQREVARGVPPPVEHRQVEPPKPSFSQPNLPIRAAKWVPPALRAQLLSQEAFAVTSIELVEDPSRKGEPHRVRMPTVARPAAPLSKRQQAFLRLPPARARWDILSFDPPVEGMNLKDYSLNDVLFRRSSVFKGKIKYKVTLPQSRPSSSAYLGPATDASAVVNLPARPSTNANKPSSSGAFGRPRGADELPTWRRTLPSASEQTDSIPTPQELETISRSPPPAEDSSSRTNGTIEAKADFGGSDGGSRSRSQPKMPAGAAVAFYRDSYVDPDQTKSAVRFIVSSELEDGHPAESSMSTPTSEHLTQARPANLEENASSSRISSKVSLSPPLGAREKAESKSSDGSSDHAPLTPPTPVTWSKSFSVKDSPARPPDPEHLKMLWSQTSPKAEMTGVNSLEGIADDLTAVPFTLQEVKSEDGETPPPTVASASGPSRMSLHEVTRAFQQVPSPPAGSSTAKPATQPSPLSHTQPMRHPGYPHPPVHPPNMRPAYPGYPSPMMSHSPTPMMYPHPMAPSPVNGPPSPYPMWLVPAGQNPAVMRPVPSPYPPQYLTYSSPGVPPAMYGASPPVMMQTPQQQQQQQQPNPANGPQNRGRTPSVMSPVLQHARPQMAYPSSPGLMHPPPVMAPYPQGMPVGRGDARSPYAMPMSLHPQGSNHAPSQHNGYVPGPTPSYVRQQW